MRGTRTLTVALLTTLLTALATLPASAERQTGAEHLLAALINQHRADHDLPHLEVSEVVTQAAADWSRHMADTDTADGDNGSPKPALQFHTEVPEELRPWTMWSENIAYMWVAWGDGATDREVDAAVAELHQLLVDSAAHERNMLEPYTELGVGVELRYDPEYDATFIWVTEMFRRQTAPPADWTPPQVDPSEDGVLVIEIPPRSLTDPAEQPATPSTGDTGDDTGGSDAPNSGDAAGQASTPPRPATKPPRQRGYDWRTELYTAEEAAEIRAAHEAADRAFEEQLVAAAAEASLADPQLAAVEIETGGSTLALVAALLAAVIMAGGLFVSGRK